MRLRNKGVSAQARQTKVCTAAGAAARWTFYSLLLPVVVVT